MELIRTFFAVPPDEELHARIGALYPGCAAADGAAGRAHGALPGQSSAGPRWAALAGLHLTLVFLGATRAAQIEALGARVAGIARGLGAFAYALAGPCLFPDARRPRVLALEPLDPAGFAAWQAPLAAACEELGFAREARAFRPHLSLARLGRAPPPPIEPLRAPLPGVAREIVLYESRGGRYEPLFRVRCGAGGPA